MEDDKKLETDEQKAKETTPPPASKIKVPTETATVDDDLAGLVSMESLDPASPEIWPEQLPGARELVARNATARDESPPAWTNGLSAEDIEKMHLLGALSTSGLVAEIKKLLDEAYKLGAMEAKEMTRAKYLNIFENNPKKK